MAAIELKDIAHSYDTPAAATKRWALKPFSMTWSDGGAYALLGPSGCGKTTLLNIISGLVPPTQGRVLFDGRDVTALTPAARNIAQVFQFPVVYDTMSVFDNLAFPLRNRHWEPANIRQRVEEIAGLLELRDDLGRRARGLPAEAKQRISLGRGLVRPDVAAVLFDEPLTVIDPHLKWLLRRKLKQIHQQLKLSLIYVTHDQTEALTFADRIVVMSGGEVAQIGSAQELFETPAHRFVGEFIGTPGMNFLSCSWQGGSALIASTPLQTSNTSAPPAHDSLAVGIRPEHVELADSAGSNHLAARIVTVRDEGVHIIVEIEIEAQRIWAKLRDTRRLAATGPTFVHFPARWCGLYADGRRVA